MLPTPLFVRRRGVVHRVRRPKPTKSLRRHRTGFFDLPLEIRQHIYFLLLSISISGPLSLERLYRNPPPASTYLISRRLYNEVLQVYFTAFDPYVKADCCAVEFESRPRREPAYGSRDIISLDEETRYGRRRWLARAAKIVRLRTLRFRTPMADILIAEQGPLKTFSTEIRLLEPDGHALHRVLPKPGFGLGSLGDRRGLGSLDDWRRAAVPQYRALQAREHDRMLAAQACLDAALADMVSRPGFDGFMLGDIQGMARAIMAGSHSKSSKRKKLSLRIQIESATVTSTRATCMAYRVKQGVWSRRTF